MKYIKRIEIEFTYFNKLRLVRKKSKLIITDKDEIFTATRLFYRKKLKQSIEETYNLYDVNIISYKEVYYKWWEFWMYFKTDEYIIKSYKGRV